MHDLLGLFATTEVFVFVFMEIVIRIQPIQRVICQKAAWDDKVFFILLMGGFSIFGTYTGIELPSGAISSIRDLGPMVAGLVAGPLAGLGAGLIGGIHRYSLGGMTCIPCGLATVLAGLIGGTVFLLNKRKLIGIFQAILLAVFVEFIHGVLTLLIARPFDEAFKIVLAAIPAMMIANAMGIAIGIIVLERVLEESKKHT
jgi:sigma-B regulation protein RsbU (phosphoserine phosphatase)